MNEAIPGPPHTLSPGETGVRNQADRTIIYIGPQELKARPDSVWTQILEAVRPGLTERAFEAWLEPTEFDRVEGDVLFVRTRDGLQIADRFREDVVHAVRSPILAKINSAPRQANCGARSARTKRANQSSPLRFCDRGRRNRRPQNPYSVDSSDERSYRARPESKALSKPESALWAVAEARQYAQQLTQAAEAAETDGFLMKFLREKIGIEQLETRFQVLQEFRQYREAHGGPPAPKASDFKQLQK